MLSCIKMVFKQPHSILCSSGTTTKKISICAICEAAPKHVLYSGCGANI
jgi:hypothetical protein